MQIIFCRGNCKDVITIEPILQPLSGEILHPCSAIVDDNACSDVKAEGFWDCIGSSMLILMLKCLTQLQLPTATSLFNPVIVVWKLEINVNTKTEYYTAPSGPSSSPPLVAWVPLPLSCSKDQPPSFPSSEMSFTVKQSSSSGVSLASPYYAQQYIRCLRGSRSCSIHPGLSQH